MHWKPSVDKKREKAVAERLRRSSKFYRFLWEIRGQLFADGFEDELIASYQPRGQDPCPPALLAMVMLLQRYEGLSDARAVDAAENDRRWQLVLGTLGDDKAPFGQGSLVRFRMRVIAHDLDKKLLDRTVELAKKTGAFGWQKLRVSLDSSPLQGAGRVEDTWNLIGRAMSKVVHAVSIALDIDANEVIQGAQLSVLKANSVKTAIDIDWDDENAQLTALERLLTQVSRLERWVAKRASDESGKPPLKDALEVMRRVVDQDTEPDPSGRGHRIKDGVSKERIISLGDIEMRHGRKSKTKRIDGYKRHIAVAHNLILGTAVEAANIKESQPTQRLLNSVAQHGKIRTLDIDRGYLPASVIEGLDRSGVVINCRPWKTNKNKGLFTKKDFRIDLRRRQVSCPAGNVAKFFNTGTAWFDDDDCTTCCLKLSCTPADRRTITLHPHEDLHIRLRRQSGTKNGRQQLRRRVIVEHRLARVGMIQGPRARYTGARKNELDLNRAAAIANLQEIARLREAA
jgi:hypothetical protein